MRSGLSRLLVVAGTRPEVIKLAPLVRLLRRDGSPLDVHFCLSGQHRQLLDTVRADLEIEPDLCLEHPVGGSLSQALSRLLAGLSEVVSALAPSGVVVQGDTNTTLAAATAAFHQRVPVFHVEAGLRTADLRAPFPEEMNRRVVSRLADLHFAPTAQAVQNLLAEGVRSDQIVLTGNTGVDALRIYGTRSNREADRLLGSLRPDSRKVLLTLHRRENCELAPGVVEAVREIVRARPELDVIWVLHANAIRAHVTRALNGCPSVLLAEPQSYGAFVQLMRSAHIILTDSGGVQEEAPSLGTPVLVLRDVTERSEAVAAGNSLVVGCESKRVCAAVFELLDDPALHEKMAQVHQSFGDGFAAERIVSALESYFGVQCAQRAAS